MKILHVNDSLDIGGIENFLINLAKNMPKERDELIFLTTKNKKFYYEDRLAEMGHKVVKLKRRNNLNKISLFLKPYRAFKQISPDIIHVHMGFNAAFVMLAARLAGVKVRIIHSHSAGVRDTGALWKAYNTLRQKIILKNATDLLACSKKAGETLFGKGAKFKIIPNGITLENYKFNTRSREMLRKSLGIEKTDIVVGHVGRLDVPKNHKFLLEVFKELSERQDNYKLALVGDGLLRKDLEDRAKSLGIHESVYFLGNRNDVAELYSAFDLVVFPSIYEGLPISLVEAQANGLPILASDTIAPEIKLTDSLEFYPLNKTAEDWAKKAATLTRRDADLLALREYSIENTVEELQRIYERGER